MPPHPSPPFNSMRSRNSLDHQHFCGLDFEMPVVRNAPGSVVAFLVVKQSQKYAILLSCQVARISCLVGPSLSRQGVPSINEDDPERVGLISYGPKLPLKLPRAAGTSDDGRSLDWRFLTAILASKVRPAGDVPNQQGRNLARGKDPWFLPPKISASSGKSPARKSVIGHQRRRTFLWLTWRRD